MVMRRLVIASVIGASVLIGFGVDPSRADEPQSSHVSGQGSFEVKKQPEFLRVQVEVLAKAKTAKDALAKLQERRQAAKTKLEGMGATAESIEFGEPSVVAELDPREAQMQMMMVRRAMRMQGQGNKPAGKPKEAPPVVVSCQLKAQIRLTAPNPDEMLVLTHGLEERIKAADLGGTKALKQGSPQDEELAQEEMQNMGMMGGDEQRTRGQPFIVYVCKLTDEERIRAVREAFKRAEHQASELAGAAGQVIGPVLKLDEMPVQSNDAETQMEYVYSQMGMRMQQVNLGSDDKNVVEALGSRPAKVVYRVGVTASFEMRRLRAR
jgi:uncharacterized protein YggE